MIKYDEQKQLGRERVYLSWTSTSQFIIKEVMAGNHGRNLEAETKAEAMEEHRLLAYSS